MKKLITFIFQRPVVVLFTVLVICLVPSMVVMQAQTETKALVRMLGIDVTDEGEIEVSIICYQPTNSQTCTENYILISATDDSLTTALDKAGDYAGKQITLAHLSNVIVSNEAAEQNLIGYINHLVRTYSTNNSTNIINTNVTAKEFMEASLKAHGKSTGEETGIVEHNDQYVVGIDSNLELIVASAYKPSKTAIIDIVKVSPEEGIDLSGESETNASTGGGGGSSGGEQEEPKYFESDGSVAIIRNGRKVGELDRDEMSALNWINSKNQWAKFVLENYSDKNIQDAQVVLNITDKNIKFKTQFDAGTPTVIAEINAKASVYEVVQETQTVSLFTPREKLVTDRMSETIADKVKTDFYPVYSKLQELNVDPFDFYELFMKKNNKEFKEYLNGLENREEYMKGVKIILEVKCEGK